VRPAWTHFNGCNQSHIITSINSNFFMLIISQVVNYDTESTNYDIVNLNILKISTNLLYSP